MRFKGDFHIHTCLSPCADITMVPNEVAKKLVLYGVNWVSITDHNSCKNVRVFEKVLSKYGIKVVPGIESQSVEEVHVLSYFPSIGKAESFSDVLNTHLPNIKNDPELFGYQLLVDEEDHYIGIEEKVLSSSTDLNLFELWKLVKNFDGLFIYAHIERAFGVVKQLGFIPAVPQFDAIESKADIEIDKVIFNSSDAHSLDQLTGPKVEIEALERDFNGFSTAIERKEVWKI
jgi:PHP family Zn ribbon phosphoesterase|uniref:PHP domain-containing protein n=1 Tax=Mesoaciditoga lauensis TaxID=1495039 RepID=A0A7V3RF68_9BACT